MREQFSKRKRLFIGLTVALALLIPLCSALAASTDFSDLFQLNHNSKKYSAYKIEIEREAVPPVIEPTYPITVNYYIDAIIDDIAHYLGMISLPSAPLGTTITGVDLTMFAPVG